MKISRIIVQTLTLVLLVFVAASSLNAAEISAWKWTAENPKPVWWTWGDDYAKEKPVSGGTFRIAASMYIGLMNPHHWPVNDWVLMSYIYEILIHADGTFGPTNPFLVESWSYTGPTSAVMKFRKGVTYHDGTEFSAESMKYQFEWVMDKKNGAWTRSFIAPIKKITLVDKYTLSFDFTQPWAVFAGNVASAPGYPVSMKALKAEAALSEIGKNERKVAAARKKIEKMEAKAAKQSGKKAKKTLKKAAKEKKKLAKIEKELSRQQTLVKGAVSLDKHGVGSGPFMVDEARPGNYVKLKRNPNWWFGKTIGKPEMPYFDTIMSRVIPDPSIRLANFRAGKLDVLVPAPAQYQLLKRDPNFKVYSRIHNGWSGYWFNQAAGPCKDIRVRKAISHAIDRKALIAGVMFGLAEPAASNYPTGHWAKNPDLKPVEYNPELSKKLLAEAGYGDGLALKGYVVNSTGLVTVATAVKNMLLKVGVDWTYDTMDTVAADSRMKNLEYDFSGGAWGWIWDPDQSVSGLYHPDGNWNKGRNKNTKAIALIEKARTELDFKKRQKMYWEIEKLLYDNYEDVWLWYPKVVTAYHKRVQGYNYDFHKLGYQNYWVTHPLWLEDGGK